MLRANLANDAIRNRKDTLKEGWSFLTTTMDVQSAMEEMQKKQEAGAAEESDDMKELEGDMVGKVSNCMSRILSELTLTGQLLLVSWKGTRFVACCFCVEPP